MNFKRVIYIIYLHQIQSVSKVLLSKKIERAKQSKGYLLQSTTNDGKAE